MTLKQVQKLTTKYSIIATSILLLFFILLLWMDETHGDFANGILFFLADLFNPTVIIYAPILYGLTYFLSRKAANDIINRKSPWQTSLLISTLISLVTVMYFNIWALVRMNETGLADPGLKNALYLFFLTFCFEFVIWTFVTTKTKKLKIDVY